MAHRRDSPFRRLLICLMLLSAAAAHDHVRADGLNQRKTMKFAAEMAELGNWREARYRWEGIARERADDPAVLNNLAVAAEALGDLETAGRRYREALAAAEGEPRILENYNRFERFRRRLDVDRRAGASDADAVPAEPALATEATEATEGRDEESDDGGLSRDERARYARNSSKRFGKVDQVTVEVPVPPKLDVGERKTVLVASFLTSASALLDTNRELVRFLRSEIRKRTALEVLDVVPPPAIPEQRIDDLLANSEFWKYLGREYGADLILSGVVRFTREDASGFRDVDTVSSVTGQKVRQTQFVEQEEFVYVIDVFFFDGATGALLFRDTVSRSVIFRAQNNDPITAFFEMSESLADDVLAVIVARTRTETRSVFRTG